MDDVEQRIAVFMQLLKSIHTAVLTEYTAGFDVVASTSDHVEVLKRFFLSTFRGWEAGGSETVLDDWKGDKDPLRPAVFMNSLGMAWISEVWVQDGALQRIFTLGPVFLDDYSARDIEQELDHLDITLELKYQFLKYIFDIPVLPVTRLYEYGVMLHCCITQKSIAVSDFAYPDLEHQQLKREQTEALFQEKHGTHMIEQEILQLVETGNMDYESKWDRYISTGKLGSMGGGKYLRQQKDTVIVFITLCSRAAIRGGLSSEVALSLCDAYIAQTEKTKDLSALTELSRRMFRDFVIRVHRCQVCAQTMSPQIRKACNYIGLHPCDRNDIHTLAQLVGYSDYYFSNKFKQETGQSVRDYVMSCKVERAKQLLRESDTPIQEIGDSLGYGTPSYFSDVFRRLTGMTPSEYREKG